MWGAGKKGKRLAQLLVEKQIPFHWLSNNTSKVGHVIYGQKMHHFSDLEQLDPVQILLSVAAPDGQAEIRAYLQDRGYRQEAGDFFWFC